MLADPQPESRESPKHSSAQPSTPQPNPSQDHVSSPRDEDMDPGSLVNPDMEEPAETTRPPLGN